MIIGLVKLSCNWGRRKSLTVGDYSAQVARLRWICQNSTSYRDLLRKPSGFFLACWYWKTLSRLFYIMVFNRNVSTDCAASSQDRQSRLDFIEEWLKSFKFGSVKQKNRRNDWRSRIISGEKNENQSWEIHAHPCTKYRMWTKNHWQWRIAQEVAIDWIGSRKGVCT